MGKDKGPVLFLYVTQETKDYLKNMAIEYSQPITKVVEHIIECHRFKKKFSLKKNEPKYVAKAKAWAEKRNNDTQKDG
jgi:hypothetical protein